MSLRKSKQPQKYFFRELKRPQNGPFKVVSHYRDIYIYMCIVYFVVKQVFFFYRVSQLQVGERYKHLRNLDQNISQSESFNDHLSCNFLFEGEMKSLKATII